jgi:hypothetical protein
VQVTLKSSSLWPMNDAIEKGLRAGMAWATEALNICLFIMGGMVVERAYSKEEWRILECHFKMSEKDGWEPTGEMMRQVQARLRQVQLGLGTAFTLADGRPRMLKEWLLKNEPAMNLLENDAKITGGDLRVRGRTGEALCLLNGEGQWVSCWWALNRGRFLESSKEFVGSHSEKGSVSHGARVLPSGHWMVPDVQTVKLEGWNMTGGKDHFDREELIQVAKSIHVHFGWVEDHVKTAGKRWAATIGRVLLHEAAHKFAGARDFKYAFEPGYGAVSKINSVNNADSLALFVISVKEGLLVKGDRGDLEL